jgi:hypothetical protein
MSASATHNLANLRVTQAQRFRTLAARAGINRFDALLGGIGGRPNAQRGQRQGRNLWRGPHLLQRLGQDFGLKRGHYCDVASAKSAGWPLRPLAQR